MSYPTSTCKCTPLVHGPSTCLRPRRKAFTGCSDLPAPDGTNIGRTFGLVLFLFLLLSVFGFLDVFGWEKVSMFLIQVTDFAWRISSLAIDGDRFIYRKHLLLDIRIVTLISLLCLTVSNCQHPWSFFLAMRRSTNTFSRRTGWTDRWTDRGRSTGSMDVRDRIWLLRQIQTVWTSVWNRCCSQDHSKDRETKDNESFWIYPDVFLGQLDMVSVALALTHDHMEDVDGGLRQRTTLNRPKVQGETPLVPVRCVRGRLHHLDIPGP